MLVTLAYIYKYMWQVKMPALGNILHYEYFSDNGNGILTFNKCHLYKKFGDVVMTQYDCIVFDTLALTIFIQSKDGTKLGPFQLGII